MDVDATVRGKGLVSSLWGQDCLDSHQDQGGSHRPVTTLNLKNL